MPADKSTSKQVRGAVCGSHSFEHQIVERAHVTRSGKSKVGVVSDASELVRLIRVVTTGYLDNQHQKLN